MPGEPHNPLLKDKLAAWAAGGRSVASFAAANGTPGRTAYEWSSKPAFKGKVERIRRRYLDRIAGSLARHGTKAVAEIARLIKSGDTDAVKLAACRAMLDQLIAIANHAELEKRMVAIEKRLDEPGSPTPKS